MSDQPSSAKQRLPVMALSGFTTAILGNSFAAVRLELFTSPEKLEGLTQTVLVGMTLDQAAALGKSLLKVVEVMETSRGSGSAQAGTTS